MPARHRAESLDAFEHGTAQSTLVDRQPQLALTLDRRLDQPAEQRMRPGRARPQLRVRLVETKYG